VSGRNILPAIPFFVLLLFTPKSLTPADLAEDAARELAKKIMQTLAPVEELALKVRNISSLSATQAVEARRALETALRSNGARLTEKREGAAKVLVTLSENQGNYLWVAEIQRGERTVVVIVARPRPVPPRPGATAAMVLEKTPLFEQQRPILDVALREAGLLVLDPQALSLYHRVSQDEWEMRQSVPLERAEAWPRDVRGRLQLQGESIKVYLPGMMCTGAPAPELSLECKGDGAEWPTEFGVVDAARGKNFFSADRVIPFFTVAGVEDSGGLVWVFAGLDGRAHLYDWSLEPAGTVSGWGSDIAGIKSNCGNGRQIVVTRRGDPPEPDAIQAFEIADRQPVAVRFPVEFPGPVTALWRDETESRALAVSRDLRTGRYVAFHLSISCRR
jgi:hypothetical protein